MRITGLLPKTVHFRSVIFIDMSCPFGFGLTLQDKVESILSSPSHSERVHVRVRLDTESIEKVFVTFREISPRGFFVKFDTHAGCVPNRDESILNDRNLEVLQLYRTTT